MNITKLLSGLAVLLFLIVPKYGNATYIAWCDAHVEISHPDHEGQIFWVEEDNPWYTLTASGSSIARTAFTTKDDSDWIMHAYGIFIDRSDDDKLTYYFQTLDANQTATIAWFEVPSMSASKTLGLGEHIVQIEHTVVLSNSVILDTGVITWPIFVSAKPIPEPTTMLLVGTGLLGLAGTRIRKKFKKS